MTRRTIGHNLGIFINGEVKTRKLQLPGNREQVRNRTVREALNLLRTELSEDCKTK